jgi:hypothetical protein
MNTTEDIVREIEVTIARYRLRQDRKKVLDDLHVVARDLVDILDKEKSGVRDGDGRWHGSEPICPTLRKIDSLMQVVSCIDRHLSGPNPYVEQQLLDEIPF